MKPFFAGCEFTEVDGDLEVVVTDYMAFMGCMVVEENAICNLMEEHRQKHGKYPTRLEVDKFTHLALKEFDTRRSSMLEISPVGGYDYHELPHLDPFQGLEVAVWQIEERFVRVRK